MTAAALGDQAADHQLLVGEALLPQVPVERVAVTGREPDPERRRGLPVEAALGEELPAGRRVGRAERVDVERGGGPVGLEQPRAQVPVATLGSRALAGSGLLVAQLHAVAVREPLDRLGEPEPVDLGEELDHVATGLAAEAVEEAARGRDVERRRLLVVERAETLHRAAAGVLEGDVVGDHLVDPGALAHERDVLVPDQPCHAAESTGHLRASAGGRRRAGDGGSDRLGEEGHERPAVRRERRPGPARRPGRW